MKSRHGIKSSERGFALTFENGYTISVAIHECAYASMLNSVDGKTESISGEIAILKDGEFTGPEIIGEIWHDNVKGYLSSDEISIYIEKVRNIEV